MATPWFQKFPLIGYDSLNNGEKQLAVNIFERLKFRASLLNDYLVFYQYQVKDGERPETIAAKLYGSSSYFWIVLICNNIVDPNYDWPLSYDQLNATVQKKYGTTTQDGLIYAYQTIDHYEDIKGNIIDVQTYNSLPASQRTSVSIYQNWINLNEQKRQIVLIDPQFVSTIDSNADTLLSQNILT